MGRGREVELRPSSGCQFTSLFASRNLKEGMRLDLPQEKRKAWTGCIMQGIGRRCQQAVGLASHFQQQRGFELPLTEHHDARSLAYSISLHGNHFRVWPNALQLSHSLLFADSCHEDRNATAHHFLHVDCLLAAPYSTTGTHSKLGLSA